MPSNPNGHREKSWVKTQPPLDQEGPHLFNWVGWYCTYFGSFSKSLLTYPKVSIRKAFWKYFQDYFVMVLFQCRLPLVNLYNLRYAIGWVFCQLEWLSRTHLEPESGSTMWTKLLCLNLFPTWPDQARSTFQPIALNQHASSSFNFALQVFRIKGRVLSWTIGYPGCSEATMLWMTCSAWWKSEWRAINFHSLRFWFFLVPWLKTAKIFWRKQTTEPVPFRSASWKRRGCQNFEYWKLPLERIFLFSIEPWHFTILWLGKAPALVQFRSYPFSTVLTRMEGVIGELLELAKGQDFLSPTNSRWSFTELGCECLSLGISPRGAMVKNVPPLFAIDLQVLHGDWPSRPFWIKHLARLAQDLSIAPSSEAILQMEGEPSNQFEHSGPVEQIRTYFETVSDSQHQVFPKAKRFFLVWVNEISKTNQWSFSITTKVASKKNIGQHLADVFNEKDKMKSVCFSFYFHMFNVITCCALFHSFHSFPISFFQGHLWLCWVQFQSPVEQDLSELDSEYLAGWIFPAADCIRLQSCWKEWLPGAWKVLFWLVGWNLIGWLTGIGWSMLFCSSWLLIIFPYYYLLGSSVIN